MGLRGAFDHGLGRSPACRTACRAGAAHVLPGTLERPWIGPWPAPGASRPGRPTCLGTCSRHRQAPEFGSGGTPLGRIPAFPHRQEIAISYAPGQNQLQTAVQCYTLLFPGGRVYASDTAGRLIALALVTRHQERYSYLLEGNGDTAGGFRTVDELLQAIAGRLTAPFMEAQFRAMPDLARADVFDLSAGPHLHIKL